MSESKEANQPKSYVRQFSLSEVLLATNNFSDNQVIGKGGFGKVYKGFVNKGAITVAIKRLNIESKQGAREFWTEINTLLKIRYTHLVTLIGYSDDDEEMILVYEYISNGTLAEHLYRSSREKDPGDWHQLTWEQRLNICIGSALGLQYLHENSIIHRDVKTTNILLDENHVAKIADFGLSKMIHKQSHVSTDVKGTFGYLDPEYFHTHRLTMKSDVYAFGVVLLEVLCGRPPVDTSFEEVEQRSLALWAVKCYKKGRLLDMIDPSLREQVSPNSLKMFSKVAIDCLNKDSKRRPAMPEVVRSLKLVMKSDIDSHQHKGIVAGLSLSISRMLRSEKPVNDVILDLDTPATKKRAEHVLFWPSWPICRVTHDQNVFIPANCIRHFTMKEFRTAREHFNKSQIIASGYHTEMYKSLIDGGSREVAIKRWTGGISRPQKNNIRSEIELQSQLLGLNLGSLVRYYIDDHDALLVYDYMANGSLHHHLYKTKSCALTWENRLSICLSIANALKDLRIECPSVYQYFKSTNIFLNQHWDAKISGFNSPNLALNDASEKQYIEPELYINGRFSEKSDVYSLGVLLLELLCGRNGMIFSQTEGSTFVSIVHWFKQSMKHGLDNLTIDPYVSGPIAPECFKTYAKLTLNCLSNESTYRPTMEDVVIILKRALYQQKTWQNSKDE